VSIDKNLTTAEKNKKTKTKNRTKNTQARSSPQEETFKLLIQEEEIVLSKVELIWLNKFNARHF